MIDKVVKHFSRGPERPMEPPLHPRADISRAALRQCAPSSLLAILSAAADRPAARNRQETRRRQLNRQRNGPVALTFPLRLRHSRFPRRCPGRPRRSQAFSTQHSVPPRDEVSPNPGPPPASRRRGGCAACKSQSLHPPCWPEVRSWPPTPPDLSCSCR